MANKVCLVLASLGTLASLVVHVGGWLGSGPGHKVTFPLLAGCLLVWWRAVKSTLTAFPGRPLWQAVMAQGPGWVKHAFLPLSYYAAAYWGYVVYLAVVQGAKPSAAVWARFYSIFSLIFYFMGAAYLWAAIRRTDSTKLAPQSGERS